MGGASTEADLQREIDDLTRQVRERDEFLSVVSHELRNPISPLYMQVAVISERAAATSAPIDSAWLIKELKRLTGRFDYFLSCLDRLLDVTRIGERQIDLRPAPCDLVDIVRSTLGTFPEIQRFQIPVKLDGIASVPGHWDRLRLEQIVENLLSNAIRYGLGRPITVTVDIDEHSCARLVVRDEGVGIAPEHRATIFERFRRVGDVRRTAGFGVGLWIVAELCRAMHGSVTVASEVERGTAFTVRLPRQTPTQA